MIDILAVIQKPSATSQNINLIIGIVIIVILIIIISTFLSGKK